MSLTRYAPFRRSPAPVIADRPAAPRLACVRPAASVHPEPGSNSSLYNTTFVFFPCTGRSFPPAGGGRLCRPRSGFLLRFNELPPIRGGAPRAPFPNGTAKVALFAGFPNFLRTFFRLFSVFFDFPPPATHFPTFLPACHRFPPLPRGAARICKGRQQANTASPRDTSPGQATGRTPYYIFIIYNTVLSVLCHTIIIYYAMACTGPEAAANIFSRIIFPNGNFQDEFSSGFLSEAV